MELSILKTLNSYIMDLRSNFETVVSENDKVSVVSFLRDLVTNESVHIAPVSVVTPSGKEIKFLMYASEDQIAVVMKDEGNGLKEAELASEEGYMNEIPLYFSESSHRMSPVYRLRLTMHSLEESMNIPEKKGMEVFGLMLTHSELMNYEDMIPIWREEDVYVVDMMDNLDEVPESGFWQRQSFLEIIDNYVECIKSGNLEYDKWLSETFYLNEEEKTSDDKEDDSVVNESDVEFFRMLDDFVKPLQENVGKKVKKKDRKVEKEEKKAVEEDECRKVNPEIYVDDDDPDFKTQETVTGPDGTEMKVMVERDMPSVEVLAPMENPDEVLDELIGLDDIKDHVLGIIDMSAYNYMLLENDENAKTHKLNLHSIFCGPVGVGKTTVGRLYGALLKQAGVLSKGHVVLANRGSFVGTKWGSEEKNVRKVLKIAQGGVLLIDEAYLLVTAHKDDPGRLVLPLMLELLADEKNRDIAVILCGYTKKIETMLEINPGLKSRFVNVMNFPEFTFDQMLEMSKKRVRQFGYKFTAQGWKQYCKMLRDAYDNRDRETWGNGREVVNMLESVYMQHAKRCVKNDVSGDALYKLTSQDIPQKTFTMKKGSIGFNAR